MRRPRTKVKVATSSLGSTQVKAMRILSKGEALSLLMDVNLEYREEATP